MLIYILICMNGDLDLLEKPVLLLLGMKNGSYFFE